MNNTAVYEFTNATPVTIAPASDIAYTDVDTITITETTHGLAVKDWIYCFHSGAPAEDNDVTFAGWYQVATVPTADTFTITHIAHGSPTVANQVDRYITASTKTNIPVYLDQDGNYGLLYLDEPAESSWHALAMMRLTSAINCSMRMTNLTLSGQTTFTPWVIASGGGEIGAGRVVLRQPKNESTSFHCTVEDVDNGNWISQGVIRSSAASNLEITASSRLFPSRVSMSYPNYPEIFDAPNAFTSDDTISGNIVDVNPADGQEITGIIPFFGEAVFGAGQSESTLVVFKTNSVYLLDLNTKSLSKLQTQGVGCTIPFSIAYTRNGIIFANKSGIYRLNRDQSISYVGANVERIWNSDINLDSLSRATGHHYTIGRQYKLSVPTSGASNNSLVLVYDHERELDRRSSYGAWSKYDNHTATGWANLESDAFFGTTVAEVFKIRNEGDATDYRDDDSGISMEIKYRPMDFGLPGVRKVVGTTSLQFQMNLSSISGLTVEAATNMSDTFVSLGSTTITKGTEKVETIQYSLPTRKLEYLQLKITDSTIDEEVVLAGMQFSVSPISTDGITQRIESD